MDLQFFGKSLFFLVFGGFFLFNAVKIIKNKRFWGRSKAYANPGGALLDQISGNEYTYSEFTGLPAVLLGIFILALSMILLFFGFLFLVGAFQ